MAENSKIEWTDHTFNPWIGCQKVSPGCDHCYAEAMDRRTGGAHWGPHAERRRTSASYWRQPLKWDSEARRSGTTRRVFCASMADVFDNQVPDEWRRNLWTLIEETPNLTWLLLTKRPQNIGAMVPAWWSKGVMWPEHVWLGTTVTSQEEAARNIPLICETWARVHFLSIEPMLGPVDLRRWLHGTHEACDEIVNWVIAGGESGPHARPAHPDWFRNLRDQCQTSGTPFFFKQWGEWASVSEVEGPGAHHHFLDGATVRRVGKRTAGALLDGHEWREFPDA